MLIADLSYLEVVAEAPSIVGGAETVKTVTTTLQTSNNGTGKAITTVQTTNLDEYQLLQELGIV